MVNVKDYGAIGDGVTDDTVAIQSALNVGKNVFFPEGNYLISSKLTIVKNTPLSGRSSFVKLYGEHYSRSVIVNNATDYAIDQIGGDALFIEDLGIHTTTGGGIRISSDCGGLHVNRFFMDGCASNFYGIYSNTGYTLSIRDSRFWSANGYYGKSIYLNNCLAGEIQDCFISQQKNNGYAVELASCKGVSVHNCQLESTNVNNTTQSMIGLTGYNYNISLKNIYLEGNWHYGFDIQGTAKVLNIDNVYAWNYTNCENSQVINVGGVSHYGLKAGKINYINNSIGTVINQFIINDTSNYVDLSEGKLYIDSSSTSPQQARKWRAIIGSNVNQYIDTKYCISGQGATHAYQLSSAGTYLVTTNIITQDGNHKGMITDLICYDTTGAYTIQNVKNIQTVSSGVVAPTNMVGSVSISGVYTVTFNCNQTGVYTFVNGYKQINSL